MFKYVRIALGDMTLQSCSFAAAWFSLCPCALANVHGHADMAMYASTHCVHCGHAFWVCRHACTCLCVRMCNLRVREGQRGREGAFRKVHACSTPMPTPQQASNSTPACVCACRAKAAAEAAKMVRSPLTGELVPVDQMAEHMRVSLIDPKWRTQREAMLSKIRETTKASDEEIGANLIGLARKRPDVFGAYI